MRVGSFCKNTSEFLFDSCFAKPSAVLSSQTYVTTYLIVTLFFLFWLLKNGLQIEIWNKWNNWPCPQVFQRRRSWTLHTCFFSVWWKMKCHRLLFRAQSPFRLFRWIWWLLMLARVLFCSCKTCLLKWCLIRKLTLLFFSSPQWRESKNLVLLVSEVLRV